MKTMKGRWLLLTVLTWCNFAYSQNIYRDYAADPVSMKTHMSIDIYSYIFHNESQFYTLQPGYFYGLKNEKFLMGMAIPVVHNVFRGNFAGFENTTGLGDIKMSALYVPYYKKNTIGLERVTFALDVTAPTGEYRLGRGAGSWVYKPGVVITYRPIPEVAFYPEVKFQFSGTDVNSRGGIDGIPDPDNTEKDKALQNLSFALPMVAQLEDWDGWFGIHILYTRSLAEKTDFIFLRTDFGKMIGERSAASIRISKFIAGQPRLNVIVQANFSFFMR
ncbi:MAG: transporter [Chryseolinea sp.]